MEPLLELRWGDCGALSILRSFDQSVASSIAGAPEPKVGGTSGFLWLVITPEVVLYEADRSRGQQVAQRLLEGFTGRLHSDYYAVYWTLGGVTQAPCWSHLRRSARQVAERQPESAQAADFHERLSGLYGRGAAAQGRPVQLLEHARSPQPARPGRPARRDYEYIRCGTENVFCGVEPKTGRHFLEATSNRKTPAFAAMPQRISSSYPRARTIHLAVDNLSTHTEKACFTTFVPRAGAQLWRRFTVHCTPTHGSWLNQAEIGISLYSRQALGHDRIATLDALRRRT